MNFGHCYNRTDTIQQHQSTKGCTLNVVEMLIGLSF